MREWDIFDEIIDLGKTRGTLTYDEINDAFPSEFFSPGEMEDTLPLRSVESQEEGTAPPLAGKRPRRRAAKAAAGTK